MGNLGKIAVLFGLLIYGSSEIFENRAFGNTQSEALYSESIYIYKPKAEIPSSLDASTSVELTDLVPPRESTIEIAKLNPPARSKKRTRN